MQKKRRRKSHAWAPLRLWLRDAYIIECWEILEGKATCHRHSLIPKNRFRGSSDQWSRQGCDLWSQTGDFIVLFGIIPWRQYCTLPFLLKSLIFFHIHTGHFRSWWRVGNIVFYQCSSLKLNVYHLRCPIFFPFFWSSLVSVSVSFFFFLNCFWCFFYIYSLLPPLRGQHTAKSNPRWQPI